ncbi:hypothetical protein ACS0TY_003579 [Phlomoides rotata]
MPPSLWIIGPLLFYSYSSWFHFGKQLGFCGGQPSSPPYGPYGIHNKAVFDEIQPSTQHCLAFILASIKETDQLALGHLSGSVRELLILGRLGLSGRPSPPNSTTVIRWKPPQAGNKVNVDGSATSSPGPLFVGAIFRNSCGFFVAAFTKTVGLGVSLGG